MQAIPQEILGSWLWLPNLYAQPVKIIYDIFQRFLDINSFILIVFVEKHDSAHRAIFDGRDVVCVDEFLDFVGSCGQFNEHFIPP